VSADASHLTLAEPVRAELDKQKGSRFVALAAPVADAAAAAAVVEGERRLHADARHHCFAWRLSEDPRDVRSSDADEPAGSAGAPILRQIEGRALAGVVVVVTRWFGGVKLGVGGLVRAYGGAAALALDGGRIVRVERTARLSIEHEFAATGLVDACLRAARASTASARYDGSAVREVLVPLATLADFLTSFADATRGRGRATRIDAG
jgi:uncharacterized YigZ family protein